MPAHDARGDAVMVQLATRVPQSLLQRVRVWCIGNDTQIMAFVEAAIREALERPRGGRS